MIARTNTASFTKQMNNIVNYSLGFLEGVDRGKKIFFDKLYRQLEKTVGGAPMSNQKNS